MKPTPFPVSLSEELARALFFLTGFRAAGRLQSILPAMGHPGRPRARRGCRLAASRQARARRWATTATPHPMSRHILSAFRAQCGAPLLVPFAIPPMLARWDRALWELRQQWDAEHWGNFRFLRRLDPEPEPEPAKGRSPHPHASRSRRVEASGAGAKRLPARHHP